VSLFAKAGAPDQITLLEFDRLVPLSEEATVESAFVHLRQKGVLPAGDHNLQTRGLQSDLDVDVHTWNDRPAEGAVVVSQDVTNQGDKGIHTVDVTTILAAAIAANDAGIDGWHGLQLWSAEAQLLTWYGPLDGDLAPVLEVTYNIEPATPEDLSPRLGIDVADSRPTLVAHYAGDPDATITAVQVEVDDEATWDVAGFDSGEVASTAAQLDLATTAFAALASGNQRWWRMRIKINGRWSGWSEIVSFIYRPHSALTITVPTDNQVFTTPVPVFDWTYAAQAMVQVQVEELVGNVWWPKWTMPLTESAVTTVALPWSHFLEEDVQYRLVVEATDAFDREPVAGAGDFQRAVHHFTYSP
jgi:hypothetical protein